MGQEGAGQAGHDATRPARVEVLDAAGRVIAPTGAAPIAVFVGILLIVALSFGSAALVLAGAGRAVSPEAVPTEEAATPAPARTGPAATAQAVRVRVTSANATSRAIDAGTQHEVTFSWTLQGAREGDPITIQFYAGTRPLGQRSGTLDPSIFAFATETLTLTATLDCSTGGWSAEILTVRDLPVDGDGEATAPGAACR